jgi:hypothetical protein
MAYTPWLAEKQKATTSFKTYSGQNGTTTGRKKVKDKKKKNELKNEK